MRQTRPRRYKQFSTIGQIARDRSRKIDPDRKDDVKSDRALELAGRSQHRRAALSNSTAALYFRHRHVFCAHDHSDTATEGLGRKLVYGVSPCGTSPPTNDVVLELRTISEQIGRITFREWIVCAHHGHRNLVTIPGLNAQIVVVLSTAHRSRCGNSSRAVISYDPLGSKSQLARES
jgi:hypothetical protein